MALQIAPIKASARKILPALNVGKYESVKGKNNQTYYRTKKPLKSASRTAVLTPQGKLRISLDTKGLARRTARQRLGSGISKEDYATWINKPSDKTGKALKEGIGKMAVKAKLTGERGQAVYNKLKKMDASKLQYLYEKSQLIFDVAFSYDGTGNVAEDKINDLEFLIESYEKAFGPIA